MRPPATAQTMPPKEPAWWYIETPQFMLTLIPKIPKAEKKEHEKETHEKEGRDRDSREELEEMEAPRKKPKTKEGDVEAEAKEDRALVADADRAWAVALGAAT